MSVDQPNTSGLVNRKGLLSDRDAPIVANLRRAGCVILGVTNVSELCMWYESANFVYGRTNNPYDVRRIVGGSSGVFSFHLISFTNTVLVLKAKYSLKSKSKAQVWISQRVKTSLISSWVELLVITYM